MAIKYLRNWEWIYEAGDGYEGRHAKNILTGETMSVRQAQAAQRTLRAGSGQPKSERIRRVGKTSSRRRTTQLHGRTSTAIFTDLESAYDWVQTNASFLKTFKNHAIQIRYTERLVEHKEGSDTRKRGGYATLTIYLRYDILLRNSTWNEVAARLKTDYDMSGDNARIFIYSQER
jgi:hypothetical protein